ncbi:hypothetical protein [Anaeropeptidivorans aminofermentans]|uniref:hypothetical protein n=1 Tax=Anaeropeptidivorans aminofermentans TaxID=2934315 RepID=UPI0020259996|nr:hypothetical protein [Anaeropeptidivorans aminofermentans]MBE6013256.1 hypothetical protein [Lachnospiraceae bacterium]
MIVKCGKLDIKVKFCGVNRETLENVTGEQEYPEKIHFSKEKLDIIAEQMGVAIIGTDRFDEVVNAQLKCLYKWQKETTNPDDLKKIEEYIVSNLDMLRRSQEARSTL